MVKLKRILRDYHDAGSVNSLLAVWGFVDDETFITKSGYVGVVWQVRGVDYECMDHAQRRDLVHRFEAALRTLDERCRLYQYVCKRRIDPITAPPCSHPLANEAIQGRTAHFNARRSELYELELFFVLLYEGSPHPDATSTHLRGLVQQPLVALGEWLSASSVLRLLERDLDSAMARLHQKASAFEVQLADTVSPTRLKKSDAFRFFRRLVNYSPATRPGPQLQYDTHVDYFIADSPVDCHRTHLEVGSHHVKVLTMKEPPSGTFAHILEGLYTVPGELIGCLEWRRIPSDRMRRDIQARRRHWFNKRIALVNYVAPETRPEEMLVDESAGAMVRQLGEALTEIEVHGHFFGECSLTLVLYDENREVVERGAAEATKVLATHDGTFIAETYNLLNAWLGVVPGNSTYNVRRIGLLETNYADLSFLFTLDQGERISPHLERGALVVFETQHQTPYFYNLHVGDVGHTIILGATGTGKSFLSNVVLTHAQQYDPLTVIFDLGHSYRRLATLLGGSYVEVGLRQRGVTINPFALSPTPENLHFLHGFTRVLLEGVDSYRLSDGEDREVYAAIENMYVLEPQQRRLYTLASLLPRLLRLRLSNWVEGGRYADLFDHVEDTLSVRPCQVFAFDGMQAYPGVLEPLLFYVLHRVTERITSADAAAQLKVCMMDEAWRFIRHDRLRAYVQLALKTWRKHNAAMLLATQSIEDFASVDLLRTVVEGCPTRLFLCNPSLDRSRYTELFGLNEMELDLLADLLPRRQLLLKRPHVAKVLNLQVDPRSYWLYTNTPVDNQRVAAVCQEHGFEEGLARLAASA